ncbi:MAG: CvpA family protein [Proteobacteria bacterium]|nr:CvpA family protein [Pseudomonadota bacterium]
MEQVFNTFDLIFIALSLIFITVAFFRGFVKEISSLVIWIIALSISYFGAPIMSELLASYCSNKVVLDIASRSILFIVSFFILLLSTSGLINDLKEKVPPIFDRSLGILYGILKTLLIFGAFYAATANIYSYLLGKKQDSDSKKVPAWLANASFGNIVRISGEIVDPAVEAFIGAITKNFDKSNFIKKDQESEDKTLDDKINETVDEDVKTIDQKKGSKPSKKIDNKTSEDLEKETGYNKKDIDKMNRLIDVIGKINN